jgi:hypothetical protein
MRSLIFAIVCSVAIPAFGQSHPKNRSYPLGTLLDAVALNAAAASRTFTVGPTIGRDDLLDYSKLIVELYYDYSAVAGTINLTCLTGQTVATATYQMTTCSVGAAACTVNIGSGNFTTASLSADTYFSLRLGISGYKALSCTVTHGGGGGANDKITVTGYLVKD